MLKRIRLCAALMLACVGISAAYAESDAERLAPEWKALDKNGDGKVALTELHPMQAGAMQRQDVNGDGLISLEEYVAYDLDPGGAMHTPLPDSVKLIENLAYAASEDPRQALDIYLPVKPVVEGPLPVIAYVHGGGFLRGSKVSARSQMVPLVATGRFAAVSIGYRLSWQDTWPAQIHDIKAGIRWVRAHAEEYGLDGERICAFGPSAGGHLAAMLGTSNGEQSLEGTLGDFTGVSSDVQCAVDFFGPSDLRNAAASDPMGNASPDTKLLGGSAAENPELAASASPLVHVDSSDVPFYIVHGTADPLVAYSQSVQLDAALREAGVPVIFQTVEGGGHGTFGNAFLDVQARTQQFLEKAFYDATIQVPSNTLDAGVQ